MPELAEVETVRERLKHNLRGQKITKVLLDADNGYLFAFAKAREVRKTLLRAKVTGAGRKGKYFWIELDRKPWALFHLGMSGNWIFSDPKNSNGRQRGWGGLKLRRHNHQGTADQLAIPSFTRLLLQAENGFDPPIDFPSTPRLTTLLKKRFESPIFF